MKFALFICLCCTPYFAMAQQATKNNDLRKHHNLFLIKEMSGKKTKVYKMSSSITGQFNFTHEEKSKIVKKAKLDSTQAQKWDEIFVDKFISFKYLMNPKEEKTCKESFYLNLRGEELTICKGEKEKIIEVKKLIDKLKVIFS